MGSAKERKEEMKHIILGHGQIGKLIHALLEETKQQIWYRDISDQSEDVMEITSFDYLHVCIPYSSLFVKTVQEAITVHNPRNVIIHSTVKVGTTEQIKHDFIIYSPVNGRHDNGFLEDVKRYRKFFASARFVDFAEDNEDVKVKNEIESMFNFVCDFSFKQDIKSLEFAKLNCTTYTLENIAYEKNLYEYCKKAGLDYDKVYVKWNMNYNQGVKVDWKRPIYVHQEGVVGGHCLIPNLELLPEDYENGRIAKIKAERWK
jgi:UDP-glucose 6-dehydrogenase